MPCAVCAIYFLCKPPKKHRIATAYPAFFPLKKKNQLFFLPALGKEGESLVVLISDMLKKTLFLLYESMAFALGALRANLLRTLLSLLGVTVGIFAIITVFTMVDSLELNIRQSMSFFGDKVLRVQKWPWIFEGRYPWYKFVKRPVSSVKDFRYLEKNLQHAEAIALFATKDGRLVKQGNNAMEDINVTGVTFHFKEVSDVRLSQGRYFTQREAESNSRSIIIGFDMANNLFPGQSPLGQTIVLKGRRFSVIGVMVKQGENLIGLPSNDVTCLIAYPTFAEMYPVNSGWIEPVICIKGTKTDPGLLWLEGEVRGLMRNRRGLKSFEDDNFAINRPEMIAKAVTGIFDAISIAGAIIGSFAILVGGFGIANIMFVSVKERTPLIGIQKSLGARNSFILNQFLFEAVFLSLIGGIAGLLLVGSLTLIPMEEFRIILTAGNILTGLLLSAGIGLISGLAPAIHAARLNPVDAIRSK
jgi:putative ABC transport system permease protein